MEEPDEVKHTLHLPQHSIPANFRPEVPPGALVFDDEVLSVRGPEEASLISVAVAKKQVAMIVHFGLPQDLLNLLYLVGQLLRPRDLEETEHFRRRRQQKVAKIVQCGEP